MPGLLGALQIGSRGLQAHQLGAQITGTNIANASIPGYHREDPWMTSGAVYAGVQIASVRRAAQDYLERNVALRTAISEQNWARSQQLTPLQNAVADLGHTGLGKTLNDVFAGFRNMSASSNDLAVRSDVLGKLQNLVSHINNSATTLHEQQREVDCQIAADLAAANTQIAVIANLNKSIDVVTTAGNPAADLQDQRDRAVAELARMIGAHVDVENGSYTVSVGEGITVVKQGTPSFLAMAPDPVTGLSNIVLPNTNLGPLESRLSGAMGGLVAVRDSDIVQAQAMLDQFAYDTATAINTVHAAGYDLDGTTGTDVFAAPAAVQGSAMGLRLNSAIINNPRALAAAQGGTAATPLPGDNRNAVALVALQDQHVAGGGNQTLNEALGSIVAHVGGQKMRADSQYDEARTLLLQANNLREQESGVNIEEQMIHLTEFQTAHAATARFISVIDDMLSTLLQM